MRRIALAFAVLLCLAGNAGRAATHPKIVVNFLPCPLKQHLIEADWWSCTATPSLPVFVYGAYNMRVPLVFFAHVYLSMSRDLRAPDVAWSDTQRRISFEGPEDFRGPAAAVAAPGYQMLKPALDSKHQERSGKTTLIAKLTGTVNETLRIPAIVYRTLSVGCYGFARADGLSFSGNDASEVARAPASSDLYMTGPVGAGEGGNPGPASGCTTAFSDMSGDFVLHFPGGGTLLRSDRFDRLPASGWKNETTSISLQGIRSNTLLFKTRGGLVVKALILQIAQGSIGGVYETANTHGVFSY